ncbi:MAG: mandelate racemase [Actinobacteria bacterium]|uniref:Unannotated protein n=1 Tax=freshwater metagenome TaxID=449393 RepID=A0A6J7JIC7_9ZZZZ|nr:mandelate racemase [Actinomycetota bacterium]
MRVSKLQVFEYDVAWVHGNYSMSHGRTAGTHRSLVVRVVTAEGLEGWAETCPNGRTYLPSFVEGERSALGVLGEAVIGLDPCELGPLNVAMDQVLMGSRAAKGAIDMACWDILGQATERSVAQLLGGVMQETVPLFVAIPIDSLNAMAGHVERDFATGVRVFQVKVGDEPTADVSRVRAVLEAAGPSSTVIADANGGWNLQSALLAARQLDGLPVQLEQPCRTMAECIELRKHTGLPLILDEVIVTMEDLMIAKLVAGVGGINLKPSRVGGFTRARAMRDAAEGLGMAFTVDDTWGGALTTAQNAALAASCHPDNLTATTYFSDWVDPLVATGPRTGTPGRGATPTEPGLGVVVNRDMLGPPVIDL